MTDTPSLEELMELMPFAGLIGVELLEASPDAVRGRLEWSPERCTAGGALHGGAFMALADSCAGACAVLNLPDGAISTATVESNTAFLRGVREGALTAVARPVHLGRTFCFLETELRRDDGRLAGKVSQTQAFQYPREP